MKKAKSLSTLFTVLATAAALATVVMFFFKFVSIDGYYSLTGFELVAGSKKVIDGVSKSTYQSAYYWLAWMFMVITTVFNAICFGKKTKGGAKYAAFGFSAAGMINMLVIFCAGSIQKFFDIRPLEKISNTIIHKELFFVLALVFSIVTFVLSTVSMFMIDRAAVLESNGAKLPISAKIKRWFKDNKREFKNIAWPSRNTVAKNVLVVAVMCVVVGAYIWLIDFGMARLISWILKI